MLDTDDRATTRLYLITPPALDPHEFAPRLEEFLATLKGYETNKFQLTAEQRAVIKERWGEVIDRYGY